MDSSLRKAVSVDTNKPVLAAHTLGSLTPGVFVAILASMVKPTKTLKKSSKAVPAKGGRPPLAAGMRRETMVKVPVNGDEHDRFAVAAARAGMPLSVWLRHLAIVECDRVASAG
jgi:hypothetical protein